MHLPISFAWGQQYISLSTDEDSSMKRTRRLVTLGALAASLVLALLGLTAASASTPVFKNPGAIALDHQGHLWVANSDYFGITEIQASTGKVIRVINAKADGFIDPSGIAVAGNDVWIVNGGVTYRNGTSHVGTVTELNATTGALVRTVSLKNHGITGLSAVSADAHDVWVVADGGARVAELSVTTGKVVRIRRGRQRIDMSSGIAVRANRVWIASPEISNGVIERNALSGLKVRTISPTVLEAQPGGGPKVTTFLGPQYVAVDSHSVWTANQGSVKVKLIGGSVTQINATTGQIVRTVDTTADRFWGNIRCIVSDGTHVWIVNGADEYRGRMHGDSVTELNASNGSLVRVILLHHGIYSDPYGLVSNGTDLWVTDVGGGKDGYSSVVLELSAATGAVVRTIGG
jgi:hypothetical protein